MKKNVQIYIYSIHLICENQRVDMEVISHYTLIHLSNVSLAYMAVGDTLWMKTDVLKCHFSVALIRAPQMKTYYNHIVGCNFQITGGSNERHLQNKVLRLLAVLCMQIKCCYYEVNFNLIQLPKGLRCCTLLIYVTICILVLTKINKA